MDEHLKRLIREVLVEFFGEQVPSNYKKTLNTAETAEYLGYSVSWVRANKDILPPRVSDKPILYLKSDLDKWLEGRKAENGKAGAVNVRVLKGGRH